MNKHLLEAAERGDASAQFNLGIIHHNGSIDSRHTIEGSRSEAMRWLRAAAEQGLPRAQVKLAELYVEGPNTPESSIQACAWLLLAATDLRGALLENARSAHRLAASRLTAAQIEKAEHIAQGWKPNRPVIALQREIAGGECA